MKKYTAIVNGKLVLLFLLSVFWLAGNAQQKTNGVADKINLYSIKKQAPILFIHFDKNVYSNNESVWFTGYFFNLVNEKAYKTLSVALIKDDDHTVVMDDRFVISNKLSFGNMLIPDTVAVGNYSFIAYTNRLLNGQPDVLFTQQITIKNDGRPAYTASLNPIDTALNAAQQKIMLLVSFADIKNTPSAVPISYYVGNSAHPVIKGEVKTQAGQYIFNIPSNLLSQGNNRLHAQLKYKKEISEITIDLPAPVKPAVVKFYPEGGNLVVAVKNTIGLEAKSFAGSALKAYGMLYEDNRVIDTIQTNSYGMGRFILTPKAGSNYYVKLYGAKKDTLYKLPPAIDNAPAITVQNAVANNVLLVSVNYRAHQKLHFIIHNYKQLFADTTVEMATATNRVRIYLDEMAKGLNQLTVTDDQGRPFAERLFFAHHDQQVKVQINTDKNDYATRQKVSLTIKLNQRVFPDSGLVSIACVQENRLEIKKQNDIESYFYLKHDLGDLPVKQNYLGSEDADRKFLEDILLIKGWSRYTWVDLLKTTPADTIFKYSDLAYKGVVTINDDPVKKAVSVINFNSPLNVAATDKAGKFNLNDEDLITATDKTIAFMVSKDDIKLYKINVLDPYLDFNKQLSRHLELKDSNIPQQQTTQEMELPDLGHAIHLKQVEITTAKDYTFHNKTIAMGANECGDYVCHFNVFNCVVHASRPDNTQPIPGMMYYNLKGPYIGCVVIKEKVLKFKGIYTAQEFYPPDYSKFTDSSPEYMPTIYWKYLAKVTSTNEAEFSFYTNDIPGKFKIVVQGRTADDMIYGEKTFNVLKPK